MLLHDTYGLDGFVVEIIISITREKNAKIIPAAKMINTDALFVSVNGLDENSSSSTMPEELSEEKLSHLRSKPPLSILSMLQRKQCEKCSQSL